MKETIKMAFQAITAFVGGCVVGALLMAPQIKKAPTEQAPLVLREVVALCEVSCYGAIAEWKHEGPTASCRCLSVERFPVRKRPRPLSDPKKGSGTLGSEGGIEGSVAISAEVTP